MDRCDGHVSSQQHPSSAGYKSANCALKYAAHSARRASICTSSHQPASNPVASCKKPEVSVHLCPAFPSTSDGLAVSLWTNRTVQRTEGGYFKRCSLRMPSSGIFLPIFTDISLITFDQSMYLIETTSVGLGLRYT
jgi:hypothetical protein